MMSFRRRCLLAKPDIDDEQDAAMVSAELIHNPYLLETVARFNGREPKVNSAIERFVDRSLVEWVDEVPSTFQDEMNGLDFDLYFTGTDTDYGRVVAAFSSQGITVLDASSDCADTVTSKSSSYSDVRLVHMHSIEGVDIKRREIESFLSWLESNRNRWFDFDEFIASNSEELDSSVPYIIINENSIQLDLPYVSVETVSAAQSDLAGTELSNTPILLMVNPRNTVQFRSDLLSLLRRPDVSQEQLFFYIHPTMNRERAIRVISDLGVEDPQVVDEPDDQRVLQYLDDYPSMEYIRRSIGVFQNVSNEIHTILEKVGEESVEVSEDRGKEIAELDLQMEHLRRARDLICSTSSFNSQDEIANLCQRLEDRMFSWRKKKTGVTGHDEIWKASRDYVYDIQGWVRLLETDIWMTMKTEQERIEKKLSRLYNAAGSVPSLTPEIDPPSFNCTVAFPKLLEALNSQTGTERVSSKGDFFGLFGGGGSSDAGTEEVAVASYDVWRFTAKGIVMPAVQKVVESCEQVLSDYRASLVEVYIHQLDALIEDSLEDKELVTSMLSDAERLLEDDKSWLAELDEQLLAIERN